MKHLIIILIISIISAISLNSNTYDIRSKDWVIVSGNDVNLREKPDIRSKVIDQLNLGDYVFVIDEKGLPQKINNYDGKWVKVEKLSGRNTVGWVYDQFLAYKSKFKQIKKWKYKSTYEFYSTDDEWHYVIKSDGSFTLKKVRYDGMCDNIEIEIKLYGGYQKPEDKKKDRNCVFYIDGQMMQFGNIIWAKLPKAKYGGSDYLFVKSDKLCFNCDGEYQCK